MGSPDRQNPGESHPSLWAVGALIFGAGSWLIHCGWNVPPLSGVSGFGAVVCVGLEWRRRKNIKLRGATSGTWLTAVGGVAGAIQFLIWTGVAALMVFVLLVETFSSGTFA